MHIILSVGTATEKENYMAQQNKETKRSRNTNGTNKNQKNKSKGKNELKNVLERIKGLIFRR